MLVWEHYISLCKPA